jgi:hypothetical protein
MAGGASRFAFKILSTVVAIPVGKALASGTEKVWRTARPENPPHDPRKVETSWKDALIFSVVTGLGAAAAQLLSTKGADTAWRAITGSPSPRPKEPKPKKNKSKDAQAAEVGRT